MTSRLLAEARRQTRDLLRTPDGATGSGDPAGWSFLTVSKVTGLPMDRLYELENQGLAGPGGRTEDDAWRLVDAIDAVVMDDLDRKIKPAIIRHFIAREMFIERLEDAAAIRRRERVLVLPSTVKAAETVLAKGWIVDARDEAPETITPGMFVYDIGAVIDRVRAAADAWWAEHPGTFRPAWL